jgi:hypothetical protein
VLDAIVPDAEPAPEVPEYWSPLPMNLMLSCLIAMCCQFTDGAAPTPPKVEWSQVVLWKSDSLSARLLFQPTVSIADRSWIALELENHTQQPIELGQTWISLSTASKDDGNAKSDCQIGLSGTMPSIKTVPPGRQRYDGDTLRFAVTNTVCSGAETRVDVLVRISTQTKGGQSFETATGTTFSFERRPPTEAQLKLMSDELKRQLVDAAFPDADGARLLTLLSAPTVVQTLTVDDYLSTLKVTRNWNLRYLLLPHLFARHAEDPKVLEYYRKMFQQHPDLVYEDASIPTVWNKEFLEPLVKGCEQGKWRYFTGLSRHVPAWRNDNNAVSRVSAVLLNHHAILKRDIKDIPENELVNWAKAVRDASSVPDPKIVNLLKPALDDQRRADIDLGSGGIQEARVCDRGLVAILTILDGDSWAAFKAAGIPGWKTKAERESAHDRVIKILKARFKAEPATEAK